MADEFEEGDAARVTGGRLDGFIGRYRGVADDQEARVSVVLFGLPQEFSVPLTDLAATDKEPPRPRVTMTLPPETDE